jgi:imidazolonepropionase
MKKNTAPAKKKVPVASKLAKKDPSRVLAKTQVKNTAKDPAKVKAGPQVFTHASFVYSGEAIFKKEGRNLTESDLAPIADGAIVFDQKKIIWVGPTSELPKNYEKLKTTDLKGKKAIIPGLIDSHTHLVFGGTRAHEFARRCGGATYEQIANEGGGILTTVHGTRNASLETLFESALKRALIAYRFGVRTMECKSGYGLDHETEMKCLTVISHLKVALPQMTFVSTYMGAHAIPKDRKKSEYLDEMLHKTMPEVAKAKLAEFCDVFIDEGYYSVPEGERILRTARKLGFKLKVHADEMYNTESTKLAVKLKAHSADHLLKISERGIEDLSRSNTIATLLPGTAFYLKEPYAPARKILDAGGRVAIATDFNPGSCYSLNLPLMLNLSALYLQMNVAEIFAAVTVNAAKALDLDLRKGTLMPGYDSDFIVLPYDRFEEMYYRLGW